MAAIHVIPPSPTTTIACGIIFPIVSGVTVLLRFYCRHVQQATFRIDDWLTIPAWFCVTGMGICLAIGAIRKGYAYPSPQPKPWQDPNYFTAPEIIIARKLQYPLELLQFPAITCIKLSFLFFYKRIFSTPQTVILNFILWTTIILCTLWGVAFLFAWIFVCDTNVSALWSAPIVFRQYCRHILPENFWIGITDFVLDVVVFLIPIPLILSLHLSTERKLALLTIFAVGALTLAASITRMVISVKVTQMLKKTYKSSRTNNLTVTAGLYWTTFECGIGLVAACLPTVYTLFKRIRGRYSVHKSSSSPRSRSWSNKYAPFDLERSKRVHKTVSEIEFTPISTARRTVNTRISKEYEDNSSRTIQTQRDGIVVSTTIRLE